MRPRPRGSAKPDEAAEAMGELRSPLSRQHAPDRQPSESGFSAQASHFSTLAAASVFVSRSPDRRSAVESGWLRCARSRPRDESRLMPNWLRDQNALA
jgi:hypothetical protein